MSGPSQRDRVLDALRAAGGRGVTQVDFMLPAVVDGGVPITRLAARVEELRDQGYAITSGERRQKCTVYRLTTATHAAPAATQDGGQPLALFDPPASPTGAYDDRDGAAA